MRRAVSWPFALGVVAVVLAWVAAVHVSSAFQVWGNVISPGPPSRIEWCGRRYYPGSDRLTLAQVKQTIDNTVHEGDLREVARSPWGYSVMAAPLSPEQQAAFDTQVCAMEVYVKLGSDSYQPYGLSGGP